jgi:hypothetical protein
MPDGLARGCLNWADAAQGGERGVASEPVWVVAGGDQQRGSGVWADAVAVEQAGGNLYYDPFTGDDGCLARWSPTRNARR